MHTHSWLFPHKKGNENLRDEEQPLSMSSACTLTLVTESFATNHQRDKAAAGELRAYVKNNKKTKTK